MSGFPVPTTRRRRTTALGTVLGVCSLALAACGSAGPPPVTYVLGPPEAGTEGSESLTGRPVVEVKPVLLPDYLDVTDILVRRAANMVASSATGRWGERLSVGVTRALALGLTRRLPDIIVTTTEPTERPARQLLAEVETFEPRADGSVVLVARWRVLDGGGRETLAGERVSLKESMAEPGDAAIVAAMTQAVENLADRVAAGVRRAMPAPRPGR
ncbi:PqiC family protein [Roseomonas chloroacetimidivorans]|uniref:PqiC family protein n=1 Tax=Roseomonas chloroacetimidivorans TaxID=1766656 RepID=UPI003C70A3E4